MLNMLNAGYVKYVKCWLFFWNTLQNRRSFSWSLCYKIHLFQSQNPESLLVIPAILPVLASAEHMQRNKINPTYITLI